MNERAIGLAVERSSRRLRGLSLTSASCSDLPRMS